VNGIGWVDMLHIVATPQQMQKCRKVKSYIGKACPFLLKICWGLLCVVKFGEAILGISLFLLVISWLISRTGRAPVDDETNAIILCGCGCLNLEVG